MSVECENVKFEDGVFQFENVGALSFYFFDFFAFLSRKIHTKPFIISIYSFWEFQLAA